MCVLICVMMSVESLYICTIVLYIDDCYDVSILCIIEEGDGGGEDVREVSID